MNDVDKDLDCIGVLICTVCSMLVSATVIYFGWVLFMFK